MNASPKVVIIGGGGAGLTAAHELKVRGYDIVVIERERTFGGKARSGIVPETWPNKDIIGLPTEHGFRFFPGFYRHLPRTMAQIPCGSGKFVINNLVDMTQAAYARAGQPYFRIPTKSPGRIRDLVRGLRQFVNNPSLRLTIEESTFAVIQLLKAMSTCDERREAQLDNVSWWDYMLADQMSEAYRSVVVNGLTQNFVAMDAEKSSTKSVINILARLLNDLMTTGHTMDRILNGPTSEVWIEPWQRYLERNVPGQGRVELLSETEVSALRFDAGKNRITGLLTKEKPLELQNALYIAAVPIEAMILILKNPDTSPDLVEHSPSLKLLFEPTLQVNWMSGIQYYLRDDIPMFPGHVVHLSSSWALTSISQNQFWRRKLDGYGTGKARGVVSAIISDWFKPGNGGKWPARASDADCADQVAAETLAEIRANVCRNQGADLDPSDILG